MDINCNDLMNLFHNFNCYQTLEELTLSDIKYVPGLDSLESNLLNNVVDRLHHLKENLDEEALRRREIFSKDKRLISPWF
jgi:hypothetical protein